MNELTDAEIRAIVTDTPALQYTGVNPLHRKLATAATAKEAGAASKHLHYWTVSDWMSEPDMNKSAFSIWASPLFITHAKELVAAMDMKRVQDRSIAIVTQAGWKSVRQAEGYYNFREEVGLAGISAPGNACGLYQDFTGLYDKMGYTLSPHNIDGPLQQATLMALWVFWAKSVQAHAGILR